jgi:ferrous iron transport protein B
LLEDSGYLPRIAFNLDYPFKKCNACGKQALTMCMGFGCNAVGVTGCRIIDSKRERLLAILTNNLVPCNGRFPTIIALITMFLCIGTGVTQSLFSALVLTAVILLGIITTFLITKLLSKTVLKGVPSSYTLELPPYRKPQFLKVIIRSSLDRTIFVLGRSIAVAAPAGLLIWIMANLNINGASLLYHCANFLDPFAQLLGLDGIILLSFILGSPANEIVMPIAIMGYMGDGALTELSGLTAMKEILISNGWTITTAISVILFSLLHWPCATTILTIKKETGSIKWTAISILLPTLLSIITCLIFNFIMNL